MSERADAFQVRQWQESVASDPASPAFLPLAEVYRREGRLDVAMRLCIRGLEKNSEHVEAHFLLGRLYRETGELERAFDEWDIALRLDPAHRAARRAIGYLCLERRDFDAAVRHLEAAAAAEPADHRLAGALEMARRRAASDAAEEVDISAGLAVPLDRFLRETNVRFVMVFDHAGRIIARQGFASGFDVAGFASLGAGVHSASGEIAGMLGQHRFEQLYQGAGEHQLFLAPVETSAGELLLAAVFGADATIGMVRLKFAEFARTAVELPLSSGPRAVRPDAESFEAALQAGLGTRVSGS